MSSAELRTLRVERVDAVVDLVLDRPERRNAIDLRMASELREQLAVLSRDREVRVVVLRGAGGNFCSGGDLTPPGDGSGSSGSAGSAAARTRQMLHDVYGEMALALHRFSKPVIASVEGIAAGAGVNLALGCDLVLAARGARFTEVFVKRGLSLDCGGSWLLPRLVGLQKAKELAFYGDWVSADDAQRIGLVNRVFPDDELAAGTRDWAQRLAEQAPVAVSLIKQGLNRSFGVTMAEALEHEADAQGIATATDDFAEGMRAFLEKRKPRYTGG